MNYLKNPSFERAARESDQLEDWRTAVAGSYTLPSVLDGAASFEGTSAANPVNNLRQDVLMTPLRLYTISAWVRANGASPLATITVRQMQSELGAAPAIESPLVELSTVFKTSGCSASVQQPQISTAGRTIDNNWTRFECSFLTASSTKYATIEIDGSNTVVDAIQLEEGQFATPFVDGFASNLSVLHMKVAPDDLKCSGRPTDAPECNNFAKICRQVDAGCQGYTDKTGGTEIPAILTTNDICPQECVGYAEFRKQPSAFDLINDPDTRFSDPADATSSYFIASTAQQCTQQDVGCEAFTNVAAAGAGGEQSSYYSYLRACRLPDADRTKTFFTWEGAESSGYQLRTYSLWAETGVAAPGPEILAKRGPDGAFKEPSSCNEALWRTGIDPDCRQFYDRDGNVFYRYYSQTILSTADCTTLRISRSSNADDCSKTGGDYTAATGECVYRTFLGESRSCSATAVSCRAYAGASAGNTQVVLSENFRADRGAFTAGTISPESLLVGDQSLRLSDGEPSTGASFVSLANGLYRVSFWAKSAGRSDLSINLGIRGTAAPDSTPVQVGSVRLASDWQRYSVGLFSGADLAASSTLVMTLTGAGARVAFIDEVKIERIRDTAYVIQNTWKTPISCDRSFAGAIEPQAMLGCRVYNDRFNREVNAFRFSRLCREEGIGCSAFVDTRNSRNVFSETFALNDRSPVPVYNDPRVQFSGTTTTRSADRMLYLVYEESKVCRAENASCRAFGKPVYSNDKKSIDSYQTVYYKDDITKYDEALCRPSEEFCEEYTYSGASDYFKDPQNQLCEYRESVRLSAADFPDATAGSVLDTLPEGEYSGWFQKNAAGNVPCYPDALEGGRSFPMPRRGDSIYSGWVGMCPSEVSECTEFRDINDTSDPLYNSGKPYFFINDSRLDKTSCGGNIDLGEGCVLLRDMSDPVLKYNVAASYGKYENNDFRPIAPLDCLRNPSDPGCTAVLAEENDANVLVKVKLDRDCAQWLGCRSSETVFDPSTSEYKEVCTNVDMCDKATGKKGEIFCANYVNRSSETGERVLQTGRFFDIGAYSGRPVGFGEKDYSGYAIPNAFQVPELVTTRVGLEGAKNVERSAYRFALDYRLAAAVRMPPARILPTGVCEHTRLPRANEAIVLDGQPVAIANPSLKLCQHVATGIIGYYVANDCRSANSNFTCYLPVKSGGLNYNFQNVSTRFGLEDPRGDATLTNAYPPAECRANPEADSPFSTNFVTEWDVTKNPPQPKSKLGGFQSANNCEFGEDCVCNYKRATFGQGGIVKFYGPLSSNVPPGICQGGPRDGQSCLPSTLFQVQSQTSRTTKKDAASAEASELVQGVEGSNAAQSCGPAEGGGRCIAFSKLEIIRGAFGQCLERDETRILGEDQANKPCLTWNPNPILFGDKDSFHYQPTSGYMPPQNSGQYYCASPVVPSVKTRLIWTSFSQFDGVHNGSGSEGSAREVDWDNMYYAGDDDWDHASADDIFGGDRRSKLRFFAGQMTKIDYHDDWVSADNNGILGEDQNYYASIFGANPSSYYTATNDCELADDDQDDDGSFDDLGGDNEVDRYGIRLVDAGSGYGEYFLRTNDQNLAVQLQMLAQKRSADGEYTVERTAENRQLFEANLNDNKISYFRIDPIKGPNGRIACGYQAAWVDNLGKVDYDSAESNRQKDTEWRDKFYENYNPYLTRGQEGFFTNRGNEPYQVDCVGAESGNKCYIKYWELDYRSENKKKFIGLQRLNEEGNPTDIIARNLETIREKPLQSTCQGKPYFAIRAVFESVTSNTVGDRPTTDQLAGPWRFVGFWVSACAGETTDQRYIYMNIEVGTAGVCKELAEVRSVNSMQDAAFTDRVWKQGDYIETNTGLQYSDSGSPFASAINTRPAGKDPLFMSGSEITGFSPLKPPAFLAPPAQSYHRSYNVPKDKYAYLSNLFARIYRVYRFQFLPVSKNDKACALGPFKGTRCAVNVGSELGSAACRYDGKCQENLSESEIAKLKVCKGGISRALACGNNPDFDICNIPTFSRRSDGALISLMNACAPAAGWVETSPGSGFWSNDGGVNTFSTERAPAGTFKCQTNLGPNITGSRNCKAPSKASTDCPVRINGRGCNTGGYCDEVTSSDIKLNLVGLTSTDTATSCEDDSDCNFEAATPNLCVSPPQDDVLTLLRCKGGVRDGQLCIKNYTAAAAEGMYGSCVLSMDRTEKDAVNFSCRDVSDADGSPTATCLKPGAPDVPTTELNPDRDNNICTHSGGYQPRIDMCPDPEDEFCGLIAYRITDRTVVAGAERGSLDPKSPFPLPTDHTFGMYTPTFLGFTDVGIGAATFRYMSYYTPRPPRIAAPDTRNCPAIGQCPISRIDAFSFNGQTDGLVNVGGGSYKANLRFYAWAAHNQMPLRQMVIDWGDGKTQRVDDTRMKNRKPFCGVQRECSLAPGLSCQTNVDCPAGTGICAPVGTCTQNANISCSSDADCTVGGIKDTCKVRTLFGNSTEACQTGYFDFAHQYTCGARERSLLPSCRSETRAPFVSAGQCYFGQTSDGFIVNDVFNGIRPSCETLADCAVEGSPIGTDWSCGPSTTLLESAPPRCSRDPNRACRTPGSTTECAPGDICLDGLAPTGGCFDDQTNSCRFTPRVQVMDNWGWCTGECRSGITGGQADDTANSLVRHPNGGCWSGSTLGAAKQNIRFNSFAASENRNTTVVAQVNECATDLLNDMIVPLPQTNPDRRPLRPWVAYPGSLQIRQNAE